LSTNKKDFIKNLINESLSVEAGEIKGKEALSKTLFKLSIWAICFEYFLSEEHDVFKKHKAIKEINIKFIVFIDILF